MGIVLNYSPDRVIFQIETGECVIFYGSDTPAFVGPPTNVHRIEREEFSFYVGIPGKVMGLPDQIPDTLCIVSEEVLVALKRQGCTREDIVCPARLPQDDPVLNSKGEVVAVTKFRCLL